MALPFAGEQTGIHRLSRFNQVLAVGITAVEHSALFGFRATNPSRHSAFAQYQTQFNAFFCPATGRMKEDRQISTR
jgi:hypothetical protein